MATLQQNWKKSGKQAWSSTSSYNYNMDVLEIKADTEEEEAIKFFDENNGFGKSGKCPPYVVRHTFKNGVLTSLATYCGYD
jgi:hypothetical protein